MPSAPVRPSPCPTSDEIGDRLLALVAEARAAGVDPEHALRDAVRRVLPDLRPGASRVLSIERDPSEGGRDGQVQFPCLWFDGNAEEAAELLRRPAAGQPDPKVWRSPAETPSGPEGMVLTVDFTLAGQQFQGLNGGPDFKFNEAVSFVIECDDQAEVDRLWDALTAGGGEPGPVRLAQGPLRAVLADRAAPA